MTVGDKICYHRIINGLSRKDLGIKAGFSKTTAAIRISQYENNQMIPKAEILKKIADALNVDISALANINIQTTDELLHTFFELENKFNVKISKNNDSYSISFNNLGVQNRLLQSYLDAWYHKQQRFILNLDSEEDYNLWRSHFPLDIRGNETIVENKLAQKYNPLKERLQKENFSISKLSDIAIIVRYLYENIKHKKSYRNGHYIDWSDFLGILSFENEELLSLSEETSIEYAKFLLSMDFLNSLNIRVEKLTHTLEGKTYSDFYFFTGPIWVIITSIEEILAIDDKDEAKIRYNDFLDLFNVPIIDYRR